MFDRILIAYDGSTEAKKALDTGLRLAATLGSAATLVTVMEPLPGYVNIAQTVAPSLPAELRQASRQRFEEMQLEVKQRASKTGVAITTLLIEGRETRGILEATKTTHADLLVVGLRRHATNVELAGTVRRIANECPCPILAVSAC